jgi:hypothetical protein
MSLPKKNSRAIKIGDKGYRYLIKSGRTSDGEPTANLFVQEDCDKPGNPLSVSLFNIMINDMSSNLGIGPGDVVQIIQRSIDNGWNPSKKGPAFVLNKPIEVVRK